ncbi:phosphatidylethanolamine-binding protein [Exophiala viscosa]|uniref:phosphatidylethanolamine-binding protein n=1 Tax=Exophiala viscosa TaxID=2486360 RepID=UPI0021A04F97|nr:phosphatidylethanolamine-binding protein [Exophiala viscosa]
MSWLKYLEYYLARLLYNNRGRDAKLLINSALLKDIPKNIHVESPDVGPSESHLGLEYSQYGGSKFPQLSWSLALDAKISQADIKEYMLLIEDPDAPLPLVPNHGMYYAIPATKTSIGPDDLKLDPARQDNGEKWLKGGFRLGKNLRGSLYSGPRPPVGHGPHRYFFQLIALREKVDSTNLSPVATKSELMEHIKGKVIGYGVWIGVFEKKWD